MRISLVVIVGKILARVLLKQLILHLEDGYLPESQYGFQKHPKNGQHGVCYLTTTGEMTEVEQRSVYNAC